MSVITMVVVIRTRTFVKVLADLLLLCMVVVGCSVSNVKIGHSNLRGTKPVESPLGSIGPCQ